MTDYSPVTVTGAAPDSQSNPPLKDRAAETAQAAKDAGAEVAGIAGEQAKDVAAETKRQARDLFGEARGQLQQQATDQQRNLVRNLRLIGDDLHGMTERSERSGIASELASQAGDRVHGLADWLDGRQPGEVLDQLRSFARRRPGMFLLGTALAGVVAGRLTRGIAAAPSAHADDSSGAAQLAVGVGDYPAAIATPPDIDWQSAPTSEFSSPGAAQYPPVVGGYPPPPVPGSPAPLPGAGYGVPPAAGDYQPPPPDYGAPAGWYESAPTTEFPFPSPSDGGYGDEVER